MHGQDAHAKFQNGVHRTHYKKIKGKIMLIVHVFVHVKPDKIEAFKAATIENARKSVGEPGIARFDFVQQKDDSARFVLVEVYRTSDDPAKHKETAHYKKWRDTVEDMMAEPRTSVKYSNIFPDENGWDFVEKL
jgi:autoinducer 2-degrading protein